VDTTEAGTTRTQKQNNQTLETPKEATHDSPDSTHQSNEGEKNLDTTSLSMMSILGPILTLFICSASCRCLLAFLIFRRTNQVHEFEFDSVGQIQRTSRQMPISQRISFWQAFRTIPTRTRAQSFQARRNRNQRLILEMTNRLNEQRVANGARPLSTESLGLLFSNNRERFNGNDYNSLWGLQEENGPALGDMLSQAGASDEEIARCPMRFLEEGDELVHNNNTDIEEGNANSLSQEQEDKKCSICLEDFEVGQMVRTIPCFHSFHTKCIDQWLREKAICPICKNPAVG